MSVRVPSSCRSSKRAQRQHRWAESELQIHGRQSSSDPGSTAGCAALLPDRGPSASASGSPIRPAASRESRRSDRRARQAVENRALDRRRAAARATYTQGMLNVAAACLAASRLTSNDPGDRIVESAIGRACAVRTMPPAPMMTMGRGFEGRGQVWGRSGLNLPSANTDPRLRVGPQPDDASAAARAAARPGTEAGQRVSRRSEALRGIVEFWSCAHCVGASAPCCSRSPLWALAPRQPPRRP